MSFVGATPSDCQVVPPSRVTSTPPPTAQTVPARFGSTAIDQTPLSTPRQVVPPSVLRSTPSGSSSENLLAMYRIPEPAAWISVMSRGVLGRMACHVAPASRERKATVFSSPRVMAYTFLLSAGSTAIEYTHPSESAYPRLRPGAGRSPDRRQERPASVLLSTPSFVPA